MTDYTSLLYRPDPCEIGQIKAAEILKRRKIRILQARRMAKMHSSTARILYNEKIRRKLNKEAELLRNQQLVSDTKLLHDKQKALDDAMDNFAGGHRIASSWKDPAIEVEKQQTEAKIIEQLRFVEAYNGLMLSRVQSQKETELRRQFRETAKAVERERATAIAALPLPEPDPLEPHLNSNGTKCSFCPREKPKEYHLLVEVESPRRRNVTDSVGIKIEKGQCDVNVKRTGAISAAEKEGVGVSGDAFIAALAENERVEIERQRAERVAAEAALKTQVRAQIALKRIQAMQEYQELMRQFDSASVQSAYQDKHVLPDGEHPERPFRPEAGPFRSDLAHLGPGERADLPSLKTSIQHTSSFQSRLSPSLEPAPSSTYDGNLPILSLSMTHFDSPVSRTAGGLQEASSVSTDLYVPKSRKIHFANPEPPQPSIVDSSRSTSSTTSREPSFYERVKMQLNSEVESLDEEIRKLHESYSNNLRSKLLAEGSGEEAIALEPTIHHLKDDERLHVLSNREADELVCSRAELPILSENVGREHPISFKAHASKTLTLDPTSVEGVRESVDFSDSAILVGSVPSVKSVEEKTKPVMNKPSIPISDSLRRRAAELIQRQTERLRSTRSGALQTPSKLLSNNSADVHSVNKNITPSTVSVNSCQSSDLCLSLLTSTTSSTVDVPLASSDNVVLRSAGKETRRMNDYQPATGGETELSIGVTTEPAPTKQEILQKYLKQLLGTYEVKSVAEADTVETTGISASPDQPPALCLNQSNNSFIPPEFPVSRLMPPESRRNVIANNPEVAEGGDLPSKKIAGNGSSVQNSSVSLNSMHSDPDSIITSSSFGQFTKLESRNLPEVSKLSKIFEEEGLNTQETNYSKVSDNQSVRTNKLSRENSISLTSSCSKSDPAIASCSSGHSVCQLNDLSSVSPRITTANSSTSIENDELITLKTTRQTKLPTINLMYEKDSIVAVPSTQFSSTRSDSESVVNSSSSGRPMNHFTELSLRALSSLRSNSELDLSYTSSSSMKRKIAIVKQPKVDEPRQMTLSRLSSQEEYAVPSQRKIAIMKSVKESDSEGIQANAQSNSTSGPYPSANYQLWSNESAVFSGDSRLLSSNSSHQTAKSTLPGAGYVIDSPTTPSPYQNRIWFQRSKYCLHSLGSNLESDGDSPKTLVSSTQTDSTPNTSSRPSNQLSHLSSASSVCKPSPQVEVNPPASQYSSTLTTLHLLRSGLSSEIPSGLEASSQQRCISASTLTFLRRDPTQVEPLSPISSDLSSLLSTNNSASNNDEPHPDILLNGASLHLEMPLRRRSPVAASRSTSLEMLTCRSTQIQSEITHRKVSPSPVSTLEQLRCDSIPPTPVLSSDEHVEPVKPHSSPGCELAGSESTTTNFDSPIFYSLTNNCVNTNAIPGSKAGKDGEGVETKGCETDCDDEGNMESCVSSCLSMDSSVENVRCYDDAELARVCQTARSTASTITSVEKALCISCDVKESCLCTTLSVPTSSCNVIGVSMTTGERYQPAPTCDLKPLHSQCPSPNCRVQQLTCSNLCTRSICDLPLNTCGTAPIGASNGAQSGVFIGQSINVETSLVNISRQCASITARDVNDVLADYANVAATFSSETNSPNATVVRGSISRQSGAAAKTETGSKHAECTCQVTPGISATISSRITINSSTGTHKRKQGGTNTSPIEQAIGSRNLISPEETNLIVCNEPNSSGMQTEISEPKVFEGKIRDSKYAVLAASTICVSGAVDTQRKVDTLESGGPKMKAEFGRSTKASESYNPKENVLGRKISDTDTKSMKWLGNDTTDIKFNHRKLGTSLDGGVNYMLDGGVPMGATEKPRPNERESITKRSSTHKSDPRFNIKSHLPQIILPRAPFAKTDDNEAIEESYLTTDETATTVNETLPSISKADIVRDRKLSDLKASFEVPTSPRRNATSKSIGESRNFGSTSDKIYDRGTKGGGSVSPVEEITPSASEAASPRDGKLSESEAGFSDSTEHALLIVRDGSTDYKPETVRDEVAESLEGSADFEVRDIEGAEVVGTKLKEFKGIAHHEKEFGYSNTPSDRTERDAIKMSRSGVLPDIKTGALVAESSNLGGAPKGSESRMSSIKGKKVDHMQAIPGKSADFETHMAISKGQMGLNEGENAEPDAAEKMKSSKTNKIGTTRGERLSRGVKSFGSNSGATDSSTWLEGTNEMASESAIPLIESEPDRIQPMNQLPNDVAMVEGRSSSTDMSGHRAKSSKDETTNMEDYGSKFAGETPDTTADGEMECQSSEGTQAADKSKVQAIEVGLKMNDAVDMSEAADHSESKPIPPAELNIGKDVISPSEDGWISNGKVANEKELIINGTSKIPSPVGQAKFRNDFLETQKPKITSDTNGLETTGVAEDAPNAVTNIGVNAKAADHEVQRLSGVQEKTTEDREASHLKDGAHSDGAIVVGESDTVLDREEITGAEKLQMRESQAKESSALKTRTSRAHSNKRRPTGRSITSSKKRGSHGGEKAHVSSVALKRESKQAEEKPGPSLSSAGLPDFLTSDTVASLARKQRIAQELEVEELGSKEDYQEDKEEEQEKEEAEKNDYDEEQKMTEPLEVPSRKTVSVKHPEAKGKSARPAKTSSSESVVIKYALPKQRFLKRKHDFMDEQGIEEVFSESFPFQRILVKKKAKPRKVANLLRKNPMPLEKDAETKPFRKHLSCRRN
ncbi:hypothetical protein Aperf_G00000037901 [Anoplocephala perfoliata]